MKVLITGGSGLIGQSLSKLLLQKGHEVRIYSRSPRSRNDGTTEYFWDPDTGQLDEKALIGIDAIVNLAGATLNHRWTPKYKSMILRSRVDSTRLIFDKIQNLEKLPEVVLSSSAVGYYPDDPDKMFDEDDPPGNSFISTVTQKWEREAQNFEELGIRVVRARTGVVLSAREGALGELVPFVKWGIGSPLGSGKQWMPWIHIDDVTRMMAFAMENKSMSGPYNFVGPENVTNKDLVKEIAGVLNRPVWLPAIPAFVLRTLLGEMAIIVLISNKVSNSKIAATGFEYRFPDLKGALTDLLK